MLMVIYPLLHSHPKGNYINIFNRREKRVRNRKGEAASRKGRDRKRRRGFRIDGEGIHKTDEKVGVVNCAKVPENVKEYSHS